MRGLKNVFKGGLPWSCGYTWRGFSTFRLAFGDGLIKILAFGNDT